MPSTTSLYVSAVLDSSTVITPSDVTFSIASAMRLPICSLAEETAATRAMSFVPETFLAFFSIASTAVSTAFSIPLRMTMGFAPAETFFRPSWTIACASSVAVVVPSPATSFVLVATSFTSCAPMFSNGSSSSTSLAIVTPSFVMSGAPNFLSSTTFLPFGPRVILTVSASLLIPPSNAFLASSP